jgi:sec-independent protein translocase protein TatC
VKRGGKKPQQPTKVFDHLRELRTRLFVCVIALVIAGIGVYFVYEQLLELLRSPLNAPLYYSTPAGSFAFVMKICFMGSLAIAIPVIVYNLIMFVRPAFLSALPLKRVYGTTFFSAILAGAGAAFGFLFIIPGALHFFEGFQVSGLSALISADSYLGFVTNVIITFVLVFQLPLLIAFIDKITPLTPKKLFKMEKWVILGSLVISFLVPFALDITTSLLIALPIVVLYNVSIVIVLIQHSAVKRRERAVERASHSIKSVAAIPQSTMSLVDLSYEDLVSEIIAEQHPVVTTAAAARTAPMTSAGMDIRPRSARPAPVSPAPWVHRVHSPINVPRARLISDIAPAVRPTSRLVSG